MSELDLKIQNVQDFAEVLRQPAGARFIAGLVDFCGVFSEQADDGARKVGLMLYRMALNVNGGEAAYIRGRDECEKIFLKEEESSDG